jgi:hypothetical protein
MNTTAFWDMVSCRVVKVYRRFKRAYCLHHQNDHPDAIHISETSVSFYDITWHYIPEGCRLHTRRREISKSHKDLYYCLKVLPS